MKRTFIQLSCLCLIGLAVFSCKKKNSEEEVLPESGETKSKYVIASPDAKWGAGKLTAWNGFPSGNISNVTSKSLQVSDVFGIRSYKSWLFDKANAAGDVGLQRYTVAEDLSIKDAGFISRATQYVVVNDQIGFYVDPDRGLLKVQKFNPSTMQRTGELNFSSLKNDSVEYQALGQHILAVKEGKLYAGIVYGTKAAMGYGDDVFNEVEFAVIDIASGNLDKTIKYKGIKGIGWGSSANDFYSLGDDGALYFYTMGFSMNLKNSSIIRIKKGETEFDQSFRINADDYQVGSSIATAWIKNGKLYTQISTEGITAGYANLGNYIFDYYSIDLNTKVATKISGIPTNHFAHANEQAIIEIDGKIYLWVQTATEKAYYVLNESNNTATRVFNVTDGGFIWGFVKL